LQASQLRCAQEEDADVRLSDTPSLLLLLVERLSRGQLDQLRHSGSSGCVDTAFIVAAVERIRRGRYD
jgi:hypothetical protein